VVLVVLILIPTGESEDGTRRGLFNRQAEQEEVDQTEPSTDVSPDQEQVVSEEQAVEPEIRQEEIDEEVEPDLPLEESNNYFIIAGSFSRLTNASDLQDKLNSRGYNAEVMITENRMYRVSVASFATKSEAERALSRIKSEPGLESCWLLSN
jgi:cell division protein FtsN